MASISFRRPKMPEIEMVFRSNSIGMLRFRYFPYRSTIESVQIPSRSLDIPLRMSITDISKGSRATYCERGRSTGLGVLQIGDVIVSKPGERERRREK
jgi:hypothetical protein